MYVVIELEGHTQSFVSCDIFCFGLFCDSFKSEKKIFLCVGSHFDFYEKVIIQCMNRYLIFSLKITNIYLIRLTKVASNPKNKFKRQF